MVRVTTTLLVMLSMGGATLVLPAAAQDAGNLGRLVEQAETEKVNAALPQQDDAIVLRTDQELDSLVAPIALYPDALLAQVLVAATFPLQIVKADRVIADSEGMSDDDLKAAIADQEWDPSVLVLLSGFPSVVQRMSDDIEWTEKLGDAMVQQDDDVLDAVQRMRAEAHDTGYLATNEAQTVQEEDGHIYITPTDPKVIYVPTYDSNVVYTQAPTAQPYIQPYNQPYTQQTYTQPYVVQQQQSANPLTNPWVAGALGFGGALLVQELWGNDDDDNDDEGWDDYWRRPRPIDYDNRQFYPRPRPYAPAYSWQTERNRYWDRQDGTWRRDMAQQQQWQEDRRDAARWAVVRNPITGDPQISHMRDRIRLTPASERNRITIDRNEEQLKQAQQRRQIQARQEQRLEADKQDAKARAARQEARQKAENQDARQRAENQEARRKAEAQEARRKADAQAERQKQDKAQARAKEEQRAKQAQQEKAKQKAQQQKAADQKAAEQKAQAQKAQQDKAQSQKAVQQKQADQQKAAQRKAQADREAQKQKAAQQQKAQQQKAQQQKEQQQAQKKRKKVCAEDDRNCKQQNN